MNVVICGSLKQLIEIKKWVKLFEGFGCNVIYPLTVDQVDSPILQKRQEYIEYIKNADLVVIISKTCGAKGDEITFNLGESTGYEYAIATHFGKEFMFV